MSSFRMAMLGAAGVGKTALIHQFRTSECINAYDCNPSECLRGKSGEGKEVVREERREGERK